MRLTKSIAIAVMLLASTWAVSQQEPAQSPTIKHVPITNAPSNSGKEMFTSYCAVCHGTDGKGGGPAASAMKTPPADLTTLEQKNNGKYPSTHVAAVIRGEAATPSHGSQEMPVWGPLFSSIDQGNPAKVQQRIANLVAYIGTLQAK
jgi:mono/diheme cytochrome c family protein